MPSASDGDSPGPAGLRAALDGAGRDGPGSRKSPVIRPRPGEAAAGAEAWPRARVAPPAPRRPETDGLPRVSGTLPSGTLPSGAACTGGGEETPETLLRSASLCPDALPGRTRPDSPGARERPARFLAGFTGPGLPPDPHSSESPAEAGTEEAFATFPDIAAAGAAAGGDGTEKPLPQPVTGTFLGRRQCRPKFNKNSNFLSGFKGFKGLALGKICKFLRSGPKP